MLPAANLGVFGIFLNFWHDCHSFGQTIEFKSLKVLGIETSCDETGIAVYDSDAGLLADGLYSQVDIHAKYGGVIPELASRDHIRKTLPLVKQVLAEAGIDQSELDAVAYTSGPGLVGALLVGASIGRSLATVSYTHLRAHET